VTDFKGKTVVLEWTNPNCPFAALHGQHAKPAKTPPPRAWWPAINSTETGRDYLAPAKLTRLECRNKPPPAAMLMDEFKITGTSYGAKTTPHMYL
jgi:hypothetical protein